MANILKYLLVALTIIGIADASYITYQKSIGLIPPCLPGFACEKVLSSPWANIGPIPLAGLGVVYYTLVLVLVVIIVLEIDVLKHSTLARRRRISILDLLQLLTTFGFLFSLYLVFIMAVLIQGWCTYCIVSAITCALLFLVAHRYVDLVRPGDSYFLKGIILNWGAWVYRTLLKPIFFRFSAETIHDLMINKGEWLGGNIITRSLTAWLLGYQQPTVQFQALGLSFPNRVGLAAGFDYNGRLSQILPEVGFGWHTIGTVTWQAYPGNPKPRLGRLPNSQALLINKGLKNEGALAIINRLHTQQLYVPTAISIAATNQTYHSTKEQIMDMAQSFLAFEHSGLQHQLYELNISCPNTFGGEPFTTPNRLEILLKVVDRLQLTRPLLVKMPIDQPDTETLALLKVLDRHQVNGVIFGNLAKNRDNPALTPEDRATWKASKGNLGGRPTFAGSNRGIKLTKKHFGRRFVIVGTGGIFSPQDAQDKIKLGADLVQLISGMIYQGPQLVGQINRSLN